MNTCTRRNILGGISGVAISLLAGCSTTREVQHQIRASPVSEIPGDVDPVSYPQPELKNDYLTKAISKAAETNQQARVTVPKSDFQNVQEKYERLPKSDQGHPGGYVRYEGVVIVVSLVKLK